MKKSVSTIILLCAAGLLTGVARANPCPWLVVAKKSGGGGCFTDKCGGGQHGEEDFVGHGLPGVPELTSFTRAAFDKEEVKKVVAAPGEGLVYMEARRLFSIHPMLGTVLRELEPTAAQIQEDMVDEHVVCASTYEVMDARGGIYRVDMERGSVITLFASGWTTSASAFTGSCGFPWHHVVAKNSQGDLQLFRVGDGVIPIGTPYPRTPITITVTTDRNAIIVVTNNGDIYLVDPQTGARTPAGVSIPATSTIAAAEVLLDGQDVYVRAVEASGKLWQADLTRNTATELANDASLQDAVGIATVALPLPKAGIVMAMSPDRDNGAIAEVKFSDGNGKPFPNLPDFRPEGGTIDKSGLNGVIANFGLEPWLETVEGLALAKYDPSFNDFGDQDVIFYSLVMKDSKGDPLQMQRLRAYSARGGVNIARMRVGGGGNRAWLVTGPGPGPNYAPQVSLYGFNTTTRQFEREVSFFAYGTPRFGVNVAAADVDGDGKDEIVTGAGPGQPFSEHVRAFRYTGTGIAPTSVNYVVNTYTYGACVGAADLAGSGKAQLVAGPGPADLPGIVTVIDPASQQSSQFAAFPNNLLDGVRVYAAAVARDIVP